VSPVCPGMTPIISGAGLAISSINIKVALHSLRSYNLFIFYTPGRKVTQKVA
jgi:hypothetical protein